MRLKSFSELMHYVILYLPLFDVKHREILVSYIKHLQCFPPLLYLTRDFDKNCTTKQNNFAKHFV